MRVLRWSYWGVVICWGLWGGCSTEVPIYAPEEDIYVIYSALNATADSQVVRISKAFQAEGDAFAYAETYDPSVPGLNVQLLGNGQVWTAEWRANVPRDTQRGTFGPTLGYYVFFTEDSQRILSGKTYRLEVRGAPDDSLFLYAETTVPPQPQFVIPRVRFSGNQECLPEWSVEDSLRLFFRRSNADMASAKQAFGFQIRVIFDYFRDAEPQRFVYGPTRMFRRSSGCESLTGEVFCYQFGRAAILRAMQNALFDTARYEYDYVRGNSCVEAFTGFLPDAFRVELAAVDANLGEYFLTKSLGFRPLNDVPPPFTNISGTFKAIGVFGSLASQETPFTISTCAEYQLGLVKLGEDPCF